MNQAIMKRDLSLEKREDGGVGGGEKKMLTGFETELISPGRWIEFQENSQLYLVLLKTMNCC